MPEKDFMQNSVQKKLGVIGGLGTNTAAPARAFVEK